MTLKDRLLHMIETDGPMPVSLYMQVCLHDPQQGYYATRPGLGRDFTTAPEISQIFGELIGLWVVHEWQALGRPNPFALIEPGPGRATLMADALRAMGMTSDGRDCLDALRLHLVEPSPALRSVQTEKLAAYAPSYITQLDELPDLPVILVANEFLDCLPARQFVKANDGNWHERKVGVKDGALCWGMDGDSASEIANAPEKHHGMEIQPGLETFALSLATHLEKDLPLRALVFDYGPDGLAPEDTLRAFQNGQQIDPLAAPGESDLTVDVDFAELRRQGEKSGLAVHGAVPQGHFLLSLGAEARMQQLVKENPTEARDIYARAARLIDPAQMGLRFKALCLSTPGLPTPAGF